METRTPGSEGGSGKRTGTKGRYRALARPYYYLIEDAVPCQLLNPQHLKKGSI